MEPTKEQIKRITLLSDWYRKEIPIIFDYRIDGPSSRPPSFTDLEFKEYYEKISSKLNTAFSEEFLQKAIPEVCFFPYQNGLIKWTDNPSWIDDAVTMLFFGFYETWRLNNQTPYVISLMSERMRHLLKSSIEKPETGKAWMEGQGLWFRSTISYFPNVDTCGKYLREQKLNPEALPYFTALLHGEWNTGISHSDPSLKDINTSYELYRGDLYPFDAMEALCEAGRLDFTEFVELCDYFDIAYYDMRLTNHNTPGAKQLAMHMNDHIWKITEELLPRYHSMYMQLNWTHPKGTKWIIRALNHIESLGLKSLTADYQSPEEPVINVILFMVSSEGYDDDDIDQNTFINDIKAFKRETLLTVLPYAFNFQREIMAALDWENVDAFRRLMLKSADINPDKPKTGGYDNDIPNSPSTTKGVVNIRQIEEAVEKAGHSNVKKIMSLFKKAGYSINNTCMLIEAVFGWNKKKVLASVGRTGQMALKAYGLLPLENGDDEVLERYLTLKAAAKECNKFGVQRRINTQGAVTVGITNLAHLAGFEDGNRFEWAMESRVSSDELPVGRQLVSEWEVELDVVKDDPKVVIYKNNKAMKTVPAKLKKNEEYISIKAKHDQLNEQAKRFRKTLEKMMESCEPITLSDLKIFIGIHSVRNLLARLILRDNKGQYGFLDADTLGLIQIGGNICKIEGSVIIAHSYHLFKDGVLSDWQHEVVKEQVVQSFKQAFRELYILTPAEEDSKIYSRRYAGHTVAGGKAAKLLQSRDWMTTSGEGVDVYKRIGHSKITAYFDFPEAGHFLSESATIDCGDVRFYKAGKAVDLKDVPPVTFSEIMRDCDLVVSVAQAENIEWDERYQSKEAINARKDILKELIDNFKIKGVSIINNFIHVNGSLANYRIHMASGVIHIEPGNYLCIIPAGYIEKGKQYYLPFSDHDYKTSEILSKIFMLVDDNKIKDTSILRQIEARSLPRAQVQ